ncbi:MAG: hypothetical protein PWP21_1504 [Thermosediminibacterales bacterium]|nr:hypothetical protein [Thermosediminibacterales bacterium]MDN5293278.1 hypothetical protein [Eubacteriales bacterium]
MIFATVGTHEQQFNRLVKKVDDIAGKYHLEGVIQIGYSTVIPQYCKYKKLMGYEEILENMRKAKIVITHGGPASIIQVLQMGKVPVVVPRQKRFKEHVDDHQVKFCQKAAEFLSIIPVYEIDELENIVVNYEKITGEMKLKRREESNLEKIIKYLDGLVD